MNGLDIFDDFRVVQFSLSKINCFPLYAQHVVFPNRLNQRFWQLSGRIFNNILLLMKSFIRIFIFHMLELSQTLAYLFSNDRMVFIIWLLISGLVCGCFLIELQRTLLIFSQATNPVEDIEFPNTITTRARRAASKEELDRIFYEMELNHLVHAIKFVLHTGMRPEPEEVCGMPDSSSYDYSSGKFVIDMVITRFGEIRSEGKSENAIREVPLSTLALQDISNQDEMKRRRGLISTFLFCNAYGSKLTPKTLSDTFRKYARQAGSNLSLYELRHTYVSIMDGQVSDKALKASVGHSESMTTQKHTVTF